jgi:hypothetical protein
LACYEARKLGGQPAPPKSKRENGTHAWAEKSEGGGRKDLWRQEKPDATWRTTRQIKTADDVGARRKTNGGKNSLVQIRSRADMDDPQIHETKVSKSYAIVCSLPTHEGQPGKQLAEGRTSSTCRTQKTRSSPASEEKMGTGAKERTQVLKYTKNSPMI